MAKQQIIVLPLVEQKLNELLDVLIFKGYFSYYENAIKYVAAIRYFMHSIPVQRRYETSRKKYGAWYCKYKPNKNTTWFISFDTDGELFVVRNITNNHTGDYPDFIRSI